MWIFFLIAAVCFAADESPAVTRARQDFEQLRRQVAAGIVPASKLVKAQEAIDDALDADVLDRTLYGYIDAQNLTPSEGDEMVNAAARRLARAQKTLDHDKGLVAAGVAPAHFADDALAEVDRRAQTLALAKSRAALLEEIVASVKAETAPAVEAAGTLKPEEFVDGADRLLDDDQIREITLSFEAHFHEPLPVSARGETAVHRALGFDHTGRVDVAVTPDSPEGVWLRKYLETKGIPYYAFRVAIPGKATGAHIHIGPGSTRLHVTD